MRLSFQLKVFSNKLWMKEETLNKLQEASTTCPTMHPRWRRRPETCFHFKTKTNSHTLVMWGTQEVDGGGGGGGGGGDTNMKKQKE